MYPNGGSGWYPNSRGVHGRHVPMTGDGGSVVDRDESGYEPPHYDENETSRPQGYLGSPYVPRGGQTNTLATPNPQQGAHNGTGVRTDSSSREGERRPIPSSHYAAVQQTKNTNKKKK
ncbi:hypothetical protein PAXRUDRAFT_8295 [Paxillus rubicundulus Ve08.2h10]|uniref:Uncharacterized protein n=1 Tax=Paxillus rubicundulus Ve08.2h10 TaxID=930991 RepID=A0A0D0DXN4_9AGAM|nr:hypothetical protein PAXRUDRAFT_8295 [Paxillus rubicundulus Ve08.2h10]